jgi:hypothetical protein
MVDDSIFKNKVYGGFFTNSQLLNTIIRTFESEGL